MRRGRARRSSTSSTRPRPATTSPRRCSTVAYITYDERYFYIGIRADDPEPQKIRAPFVDRDGVIGTDDNIAIFLDTRNDKRSAIELRVNPRGIQADGIFNDANFNEDFAPDFYYDTAAQITTTGWTAEFRIPFSSLRYGSADPQTWSILVWRNWPRDFRYAFHSAPMPRGSNCFICLTHPLTGLTGLPEASHFVAAPYVTAQQVSSPEGGLGSGLENGDFETDAGLDVKWNPSANHAVDLTLNPDFSQIEADVAADPRQPALRRLLPGEAAVLPRRLRPLRHADPGRPTRAPSPRRARARARPARSARPAYTSSRRRTAAAG